MRIGILTWGSDGDILPFLGLAEGLTRAGHTVRAVCASADGKRYEDTAARLGFTASPVAFPAHPDIAAFEAEMAPCRFPPRQGEIIMRHFLDPLDEPLAAASRELVAESDLVVGHFFAHQLKSAAEAAGRPHCPVFLQPDLFPDASLPPTGMPDLGPLNGLLWKLGGLVIDRVLLPRLNAGRRREGLAPCRHILDGAWESPVLTLVAVSRLFRERRPGWPESRQVCGALRPPIASFPMPAGLAAFLASGPPPVAMTFGSMLLTRRDAEQAVDIWREAARLAGVRAVLQDPAAPPDGVAESEVFRLPRAPHDQLFPRCALIVHHGGAGTTHASVRAGKPSVVVPHLTDQYAWGRILARLGLAPRPLERRSLTPRGLARAVRAVLDAPGMAAEALNLSRVMRHEDGVTSAVTLIERRFGSLAGEGR